MSKELSSANVSIRDPEDGSLEVFSDRFFVGVRVYEAGQFETENKEVIAFDRGIKITAVTPKGERAVKVSAMQALFLLKAMQHPEILLEIRKRAAEEKVEMMKDIADVDSMMG